MSTKRPSNCSKIHQESLKLPIYSSKVSLITSKTPPTSPLISISYSHSIHTRSYNNKFTMKINHIKSACIQHLEHIHKSPQIQRSIKSAILPHYSTIFHQNTTLEVNHYFRSLSISIRSRLYGKEKFKVRQISSTAQSSSCYRQRSPKILKECFYLCTHA